MISITYHRPNLYCKVSQQVTCLVGVIVECNDFPVASKKKKLFHCLSSLILQNTPMNRYNQATKMTLGQKGLHFDLHIVS